MYEFIYELVDNLTPVLIDDALVVLDGDLLAGVPQLVHNFTQRAAPELTFQRCLTHNLHPSWREHHGIGISPVTVLTQMITNHGDEPVRNEHTAYAGTRLGIGDSHVTTICSPSIDGMPDTQRSRLKIDIPNLQSAQFPASQTRCSVCHLR